MTTRANKPFFLEEGKKVKHHLPEHITFTLHDRRTSGETAEGGLEELPVCFWEV